MEFLNEFFKEEVVDGFKISSEMKSAWAAQIEVLLEIDRICKKNNLTWFAGWGTLLGAVRHNGFIPWDDDIDILMMRDDYDKFIKLLPSELDKEFDYLHHSVTKEYKEYFLRILNSREIRIDEQWLRRFHNCPYIVGIDIFPLDSLSDDLEEREFQRQVIDIIYSAVSVVEDKKIFEEKEECRDMISNIENMLNISLDWNLNSKNQLWALCDKVCAAYNDIHTNSITDWSDSLEKSKLQEYDRSWFDSVVYKKFENIDMPVPCGYDKLLTKIYGDWNKKLIDVAGHEYPFYKEQRELLIDFLKKTNREEMVLSLNLEV